MYILSKDTIVSSWDAKFYSFFEIAIQPLDFTKKKNSKCSIFMNKFPIDW